MSQIIADGAMASLSGTAEPIELNGAFLVRPVWSWTRPDPFRALNDARYLQSRAIADDGDRPRLEVVLDGSNLLPFHFLRIGDRVGRSVVKIQREDGATGTGFLIAPDILVTNHHVLPTPEVAAASVAMANYEVSPPNDPSGRPAVSPLDPGLLFVTNQDLDFTFCGVRGLDFLGAIPLDRDRMHVAIDETVTIIQHPRGRPKEISLRDNRVVQADSVVVQYSCDTEPGSSGSPVFNNEWRVVAIHHASVTTDSPEGRRVAGGTRARFLNEGIRLSAIALWLETADANTPEHRDQVGRLRALFGGLNHRAGFFGALGRRSNGKSAATIVAESYQSRAESLDLGVWDTRTIAAAPGAFRDRKAAIGDVIAAMRLDLWCFSRIDPAALDALVEHLWAAHGLNYRAIPTGDGRPETESGFLARKSVAFDARTIRDDPGRLLVRARLARGGEADFLLTPFPADPVALAGLAAIERRTDAIFLGDSGLISAVESFVPDAAPAPAVVTATAGADGGIAIVMGSESPIGQVFLSPNLHARLDPASLLKVAEDRDLPENLHALAGPSPIAVRLSLVPDARVPSPLLHHIRPAAEPPSAASLDTLIEQKLREMIGPVVARMLNERREGSP